MANEELAPNDTQDDGEEPRAEDFLIPEASSPDRKAVEESTVVYRATIHGPIDPWEPTISGALT